jgi:uncharacterized membrane protein
MNLQLLIGFLLSMSPFFELRAGLPVVIGYVLRNGLSIWPYFYIVLFLNSLVTIFLFLFLDFFHDKFITNRFYKKFMTQVVERSRKKAIKFEKKFSHLGFIGLALFVGIPVPGTGAWTGTLVAWTLGLNRIKSFIAISFGVTIAGFLVLLMSLGLFNGLSLFG